MPSKFYEIDCGQDEPVIMEVVAHRKVVFHGWDEEAEQAAIELGFEPSLCHIVSEAVLGDLAFWAGAADWGDTLNAELSRQAYAGNVAAVSALLMAGADIDANDRYGWDGYPLRQATEGGRPDVVRYLLKNGARWQDAYENIDEEGSAFESAESTAIAGMRPPARIKDFRETVAILEKHRRRWG